MPPLKFAVVREDPELEAELVERTHARAILLVASGGCTALALAQRFPELAVSAFDLNPRQLQHMRDKAAARGDRSLLNIEDPRPDGLNQSGEFESLFRILRLGMEELVASPSEIGEYFSGVTDHARRWISSRYFPALFASCFNDPLLDAMFGPAATQHAPAGSYPGYFQRAFERGLLDAAGPRNPFLQHVLLGYYRTLDAPAWALGAGQTPPIELIEGTLAEVAHLERFNLFSLSNVFDWSDDALTADWGGRIARAARPGAAVLVRQLNNRRDVTRFFPGFRFDEPLGVSLHARDRSLFYERVVVGFKT